MRIARGRKRNVGKRNDGTLQAVDRSPVLSKHLEVVARPNETGDRLIRRFVRKVREDGILREVSVRSSYEKPSQRRRRKHMNAVFRIRSEKNRGEM